MDLYICVCAPLCGVSAYLSHERNKNKSDHDLESIKYKQNAHWRNKRKQVKTWSQTSLVEGLPLLSLFDSMTCDSQLRNYAWGCMGPKEHRTPAVTKTKRNLQWNKPSHIPHHYHHYSFLLPYPFISSFLSRSPFVVTNVTSVEI